MVYLFFLFRPLKLIGEPIKLEESGFARKRRSHAPSTLAFMRGNSETVYIYNIRYDNIQSVYTQGFNLRINRTNESRNENNSYILLVLIINSLFIDRWNQFFNTFYLQRFKFSNIEPSNINMFFLFYRRCKYSNLF